MNKIALCFIINYEHILNKEDIWREWIQYNQDIINIYFYYKDFDKIQSGWIKEHALPEQYIYPTSYLHVIPAYISLLQYSIHDDPNNKWFIFLTDSCCPIISPYKFRYLFYNHYNCSILSWKPAWWNPAFHRRSNLHLLPKDMWLGNDPWFILTKKNAEQVIQFINVHPKLTQLICDGGYANETLFAVIFYCLNELRNQVLCESTHITDWTRQSNPNSPYVFKENTEKNRQFIENKLNKNKLSMFIRKISPDFSDDALNEYIYNYEPFYFRIYYFMFCIINDIYNYGIFIVILLSFIYYFNVFNISTDYHIYNTTHNKSLAHLQNAFASDNMYTGFPCIFDK